MTDKKVLIEKVLNEWASLPARKTTWKKWKQYVQKNFPSSFYHPNSMEEVVKLALTLKTKEHKAKTKKLKEELNTLRFLVDEFYDSKAISFTIDGKKFLSLERLEKYCKNFKGSFNLEGEFDKNINRTDLKFYFKKLVDDLKKEA